MVDICQERLMESHKKSGLRKKAGSHRRLDEHGFRDKDRIGLMALISSQNTEFLDLSKPYVLSIANLK